MAMGLDPMLPSIREPGGEALIPVLDKIAKDLALPSWTRSGPNADAKPRNMNRVAI
jgi:hypothetical protein